MKLEYPKMIPRDNSDPDNPAKQLVVKTEEEHRLKNPLHYKEDIASRPVDAQSAAEAVDKERERCIGIAELLGKDATAADVAIAIRASGPSFQEVLDGGYEPLAALKIVGGTGKPKAEKLKVAKPNPAQPALVPMPESLNSNIGQGSTTDPLVDDDPLA